MTIEQGLLHPRTFFRRGLTYLFLRRYHHGPHVSDNCMNYFTPASLCKIVYACINKMTKLLMRLFWYKPICQQYFVISYKQISFVIYSIVKKSSYKVFGDGGRDQTDYNQKEKIEGRLCTNHDIIGCNTGCFGSVAQTFFICYHKYTFHAIHSMYVSRDLIILFYISQFNICSDTA